MQEQNTVNDFKPRPSRLKIAAIILSIIVLILASGGVYLFFNRQNSSQDETIKIGLMMAFTGGSSAMGYGTSRGVQLAKEQLGAANIEVIQADSKCDPKTAPQAMNQLIDQGVVAIIGEGCSSASVASLPIANNSKVPLISPSASTPTLSIPNDYFFRVIPSDDFQGAFMANAIYSQDIKRVAVFYTNEPYGSGMNQVFREQFEAQGGQIVATATAEPDVIDLKSQMEKLNAASPEAVFFAPNSVVSGTAAIRIGREINMQQPFFGADIFYDNTIINNAPDAVEGLTVTTFPTGTSQFKSAIAREFQTTEQLYAASQAYDAFNLIYQATQRGARTGEEIQKLLSNINFEGVSAFIALDENGEISYPDYKYDLFQVQNDQFVKLEQ